MHVLGHLYIIATKLASVFTCRSAKPIAVGFPTGPKKPITSIAIQPPSQIKVVDDAKHLEISKPNNSDLSRLSRIMQNSRLHPAGRRKWPILESTSKLEKLSFEAFGVGKYGVISYCAFLLCLADRHLPGQDRRRFRQSLFASVRALYRDP
jgi:hypothetical protein